MPDGVEVQTGQVGEFARGLRLEAESGFAAAAERGADLHRHGVVFGASIPGDTVLEVKNRYARALANTDANLRAYRRAADVFAEVAEQIAREFASVDAASARAQQRVDALMRVAVARANAALVGDGL
jgi:glycerol-3-phosphate O-acyltransferase